MYAYIDGRVVPAEEARISIYDQGLLYGYGLFETIRWADGTLILWEEHMDRLFRSANVLGLAVPWTRDELASQAETLARACGWKDAGIRITLTRGRGQALMFLTCRPYTVPACPENRGRILGVLRLRRQPPETQPRVKSLNFINVCMGVEEVRQRGLDDGIFLTAEGYVCECTTANLFWIRDDKLYTPSLETGCLPGVTRGWVMDTARRTGIEVVQGTFRPADMAAADAVFSTSSLAGIMPVECIGGHTYPVFHPLLDQLRRQYETMLNPGKGRDNDGV